MSGDDLRHVRTLGDDERTEHPEAPEPAPAELRERARAVLASEFDRVLEIKTKMRAEAVVGGKEKGRDPGREAERLRGLIASLEGMSRFALRMGLLTPAENRALFAGAMKRGLHEGWSKGA